MQNYPDFIRDLHKAFEGIGRPVPLPYSLDIGLSAKQIRCARAANFLTNEKFGYRHCMGETGAGPCIVEISHGVFLDKRYIGLTVFHLDHPELDDTALGCFDNIAEAVERLRVLNGECVE